MPPTHHQPTAASMQSAFTDKCTALIKRATDDLTEKDPMDDQSPQWAKQYKDFLYAEADWMSLDADYLEAWTSSVKGQFALKSILMAAYGLPAEDVPMEAVIVIWSQLTHMSKVDLLNVETCYHEGIAGTLHTNTAQGLTEFDWGLGKRKADALER